MTPPRFIVRDGMDGAGKSSQVGPLAEWLAARGQTVTTCRNPGSTAVGDAIRAILLDRHDPQLAPTAERLVSLGGKVGVRSRFPETPLTPCDGDFPAWAQTGSQSAGPGASVPCVRHGSRAVDVNHGQFVG